MNKSKLFTCVVLSMTLVLGSCTSDEIPDFTASTPSAGLAQSLQVRSIKRYLKNTHRGTRADNYLLTPYVIDGDTVMYIAQYENGWELFSNSLTAPMSLMKSDTGSFNEVTNSDNPAFNDVLTGIISALRQNLITEAPDSMPGSRQWSLYSDDIDPGLGERNPVLTLVGSEYIEPVTHSINHLLSTEWGQSLWFNTYMPYQKNDPSEHILVGCTAVAVGQFLYYCHYKWGVPTTAPSKATYDSENNEYIFSERMFAQWDKMFKHLFDPYDPATPLFLGYLAKSMNATPEYDENGKNSSTSVINTMIEPTVRKECPDATGFKTLGLKDYDADRVRTMIFNGMPVILALNNSIVGKSGHAVVIDGIDDTVHHSIGYYAYIYPHQNPPEIDTEDHPQDEIGMSYEELVEKYGEIYVITNIFHVTYFRFNWGWYGLKNDVLISSEALKIANPDDNNTSFKYGKILDYSVSDY